MTIELHHLRRWRLTALCVVAAGLLGVFGLVADEVLEGDTVTFDTAVTSLFRTQGDPTSVAGPLWLQESVRDFTSLGSFTILGLIVAASAIYFLMAKKAGTALFLVMSVVAGTVISTVLNIVVNSGGSSIATITMAGLPNAATVVTGPAIGTLTIAPFSSVTPSAKLPVVTPGVIPGFTPGVRPGVTPGIAPPPDSSSQVVLFSPPSTPLASDAPTLLPFGNFPQSTGVVSSFASVPSGQAAVDGASATLPSTSPTVPSGSLPTSAPTADSGSICMSP